MITPEHEYFIRFILLLIQAGTELLRDIAEKALRQKNETLQQFLTSIKQAVLQQNTLPKTQQDTLYPATAQCASIEDFDITLLSYLIITHLNGYINSLALNAAKDVRELRNKYAHPRQAKMDTLQFTREWNKLVKIIIMVGNGLSKDVQEKHSHMIENIEKDQLDITAAVEEIKRLDMSRDFFENIQQSLELIKKAQDDIKRGQEDIKASQDDMKKGQEDIKQSQENLASLVDDVNNMVQKTDVAVASVNTTVLDSKAEIMGEVMQMKAMLIQLEQQRRNQGRITKVVHTVYGTVYLSADDQETVDYAETALLETTNNSIAKIEPPNLCHQALQEKVTLALKDIENLNVEVEAASKGSVTFKCKCLSVTAIVELIDYFYSSRFRRRLDDIAHALEDIVGKKISIRNVEIDRNSVEDVIVKLQKKEYEKVVQLELSCTGVDGLLHALEVFEEGKAANSFNELSKSLSDAVGMPVRLHTSLNMDQMRNAIQAIQDELDVQQPTTTGDELKLGPPTPISSVETTQPKSKTTHFPSEVHEVSTLSTHNIFFEYEGKLNTQQRQDLPALTHDICKVLETFDLNFWKKLRSYYINGELFEGDTSEYHIFFQNDDRYEFTSEYKFSLPGDKCQCEISCCAVLSSDRLLVADHTNNKLQIVNMSTESVEDKILNAKPWAITVLPNDKAAVTVPDNDQILILSTIDMSTVNSITVEGYPSGITNNQDELFVLCKSFNSTCPIVHILNLKGVYINKVRLETEFRSPSPLTSNIAVCKDRQNVYVADMMNRTVKYSFQGKRTAEYRHREMIKPQGLTMLNDGSLLVSCKESNTIHYISAELEGIYLLRIDGRRTSAICFDREKLMCYVISSFFESSIIEVLSMSFNKHLTTTENVPFKFRYHSQQSGQLETTACYKMVCTKLFPKFLPGIKYDLRILNYQKNDLRILNYQKNLNFFKITDFSGKTPEYHPSKKEQVIRSYSYKQSEKRISLIYKKMINVKYNPDEAVLNSISCCAVLSSHTLILADQGEKKLAVVDINTGSVVKQKNLGSEPFHIVVLPNNQAAVTLPYNKEIMILNKNYLYILYRIPVSECPWGIAYHNDEFYVLCEPYRSNSSSLGLNVLGLTGNRRKEVKLDVDRSFGLHHNYSNIGLGNHHFYITDYVSNAVIRYSLTGKRTNVYQHDELNEPRGLIMLEDGSLLVCSRTPGTIHHIFADLKQGYLLTRDVPGATSIGYDPVNKLIYVGCKDSMNGSTIKVFSLEEQPTQSLNQHGTELPK